MGPGGKETPATQRDRDMFSYLALTVNVAKPEVR